jgi:hypothetical protein
VIEEETGAPLDIKAPSADLTRARPAGAASDKEQIGIGAAAEARLIARDERKNPLISTFDWTDDAVQRIFRVPAGFMRNKTQERVEELARERRAEAFGEGGAIDLALVEDGIEFGKKMMAEMIATYSGPGTSPGVATTARDSTAAPTPAQEPAAGGGYLNEVRSR